MRFDSPEFADKNKAQSQEPVYVVELAFDTANTDLHYITSHTVDGLTGSITDRALKLVSGSTQKLDPAKAHATIGFVKFEVLDQSLTDLMRTKLNEDKGLRNKRVRVYKGHKGLLWSQFTLFNTYVIDNNISFKDGVYTFNCGDIQRSMKQKIFIETSTAIMASLSETDTELQVLDASKFELVYQVPSATGKTLLRGLQQRTYPAGHENAGQLVYPQLAGVDHIGLVRIPGDDADEIALFTGKTGNTLTGLIRGVLGTKAASVIVEPGTSIDDAPTVEEYIYLNMPAVKAVYALLTGAIYDAPGEFLPDHWHLGISADYIQTSSFLNIGADLWDLTDDDNGFPVLLKGLQDEEAKKLIEERIFYMLGLYAPINSQGEITLKRMQYIGPNGSYVRLLDESNVVNYGDLKYDLSEIRNSFIIRWNFDDVLDKYTRTSVLFDQQSKTRHGNTDVKIVELDTLHGSCHSHASIKYHFDSLRSRYAGPPLKIDLTLTPDQDDLEIGDVIRLNLTAFEDHTNEAGNLNRNFEVQQVSIDTRTGLVKVSLFGSSQRASDIPPEQTDTVGDTFLTSQGTEISAANFPSAVSSAGGVTTITGNITLNGNDDIYNTAAIYYCSEDLTIDAAANVTITKNVQLRVKGFLQHNGLIDGKGRGLAGGVVDSVYSHVHNPVAANLGKVGVGSSQAGGGWLIRYTPDGISLGGGNSNETDEGFTYRYGPGSLEPRVITGRDSSNVFVSLDEAGQLRGLPASLMGSSGSSGSPNYRIDRTGQNSYSSPYIQALGGNGGSGGAGLAIFCKGMAVGPASAIDLSGGDGLPGGSDEVYFNNYARDPVNDVVKAGAGAGGCPGELHIITLDSAQTFPDFNGSNFVFNSGLSPNFELYHEAISTSQVGHQRRLYRRPDNRWAFPASNPYKGGGLFHELTNWYATNAHIAFLDTSATPIQDVPPYVEKEPSFTLTEKLNTPVTPKGDRSTIEVSVTPPIFGAGEVNNYSYSLVEYRKFGETFWQLAKPASPESVIEVPTDGEIYEVRIRPVSTSKNASDTGPIKTIAVTSLYGRTDAQLAILYPFSAVNPVVDNVNGAKFKFGTARLSWDHDNSELNYFNHYEIKVSHATDGTLRTEIAAASNYEYSLAKNREDYYANRSLEGIYDEVTFSVRTVSKFKNNLDLLYKSSGESVTVDRIPPPDITTFFFANGALRWTIDNTSDLDGFEIRIAIETDDTWETSLPLTGGIITTTSFYLGATPATGSKFFIKARDFSGNYSINAAILEFGAAPSTSSTITAGTNIGTVGFSSTPPQFGSISDAAVELNSSPYQLVGVIVDGTGRFKLTIAYNGSPSLVGGPVLEIVTEGETYTTFGVNPGGGSSGINWEWGGRHAFVDGSTHNIEVRESLNTYVLNSFNTTVTAATVSTGVIGFEAGNAGSLSANNPFGQIINSLTVSSNQKILSISIDSEVEEDYFNEITFRKVVPNGQPDDGTTITKKFLKNHSYLAYQGKTTWLFTESYEWLVGGTYDVTVKKVEISV